MKAYFGPSTDIAEQRQILADLFNSPPSIVGLDIETPSITDTRVLGIGIAIPYERQSHSFYFDIFDPGLPWHLVQPSAVRKVWHNAPFDLAWNALGKFGADIDNIEDTMIVFRMFPDMPNDLASLSWNVVTQTRNMGDVLKEHSVKLVTDLPWAVTAEKCARDAAATIQLWIKYRSQVDDEYYMHERDFLSKLMHISHKGIRLDQERVVSLDREVEAQLTRLMGTADSMGFNPLSPDDVAIALNDADFFIPTNPRTGKPQTSAANLRKIDHPIARLTLACRRFNKIHSTYIHKWVGKARSFGNYRMDAATGRTSSVNENHQNLPTGKRKGDIRLSYPVRSVFLPDHEDFIDICDDFGNLLPGKLGPMGMPTGMKLDLKQIELIIIAELSGDIALKAVLADPKRDIHNEVQRALRIHSRVEAKNFVFGFFFGGDDATLIEFTGVEHLPTIQEYRRGLIQMFPQAWAWTLAQKINAVKTYKATTMFGRVLDLTMSQKNLTQRHIENCGINWPVQGSAAEAWKRILNRICPDAIPVDELRSQIHDEAWVNNIYKLPDDIEHTLPFWTPIKVTEVHDYAQPY